MLEDCNLIIVQDLDSSCTRAHMYTGTYNSAKSKRAPPNLLDMY